MLRSVLYGRLVFASRAASTTAAPAAAAAGSGKKDAASAAGKPRAKRSVPVILQAMEEHWNKSVPAPKGLLTEMLLSASSAKDVKLAESALHRYVTFNYKPSEVQTALYIKACIAQDVPERALKAVTNKSAVPMFPLRSTYHALMSSLARHGKYAGVLACFQQMVLDRVVAPDTDSYGIAIRACRLEGSKEFHDKAAVLFDALVADNVKLGGYTLLQMVLSLHQQGKDKEAVELAKKHAATAKSPLKWVNSVLEAVSSTGDLSALKTVNDKKFAKPAAAAPAAAADAAAPAS